MSPFANTFQESSDFSGLRGTRSKVAVPAGRKESPPRGRAARRRSLAAAGGPRPRGPRYAGLPPLRPLRSKARVSSKIDIAKILLEYPAPIEHSCKSSIVIVHQN